MLRTALRSAARRLQRARRLALVALPAALVGAAACSDAPTAAPADVRPSAMLGAGEDEGGVFGPVVARLRVENVYFTNGPTGDFWLTAEMAGKEIVGSVVRLRTDKGYSIDVADNSALDTDTRVGYFAVEMPVARYFTATLVKVPAPWTVKGATSLTKYVTTDVVSMGTLRANRMPIIEVSLYKDGTSPKQLLTGGTVTVASKNFFTTVSVGPTKPSRFPGVDAPEIYYAADPFSGQYGICVKTPPAGYRAPTSCTYHILTYWNARYTIDIGLKPL